jgi:membrane associated rhomboid family serine protease
VQKLIVILLAVIVVLIAPWTLAVLFAGVLAYGIWLAVVGLITAIFVAGYMYKNSEGRRQRRIQKVVDAANKRNGSQGMKP